MSLGLGRLSLSSVAALAVLVITAGPAQAQTLDGGTVVRNPDDTVTYTFNPAGPSTGASVVFGSSVPPAPLPSPNFFFFDPLNPINPGQGCQLLNPAFRNLVICLPPVNGFNFLLPPAAPNRLFVAPNVPKLPGPNAIQGGQKKDDIQGGQSDEKVDSGKGKDNVNPGPGNDNANLGPGNDKASTVDGEVDNLNGGKGKDAATVDRKDKVRNVEKVVRK